MIRELWPHTIKFDVWAMLSSEMLLHESPDEWHRLYTAIFRNDIAYIEWLCYQGMNFNILGIDDRTPLMECVMWNQFDILKCIIAYDAKIEFTNEHGVTPLLFAAQKNNRNMVDILLASGADIKKITTTGQTAISIALQYDGMVKFLIEIGCDPNHVVDGKTYLMSAALKGETNTVRVLLKSGVDSECKIDDSTALDMVEKKINGSTSRNKTPAEMKLFEVVVILRRGFMMHRKMRTFKNGMYKGKIPMSLLGDDAVSQILEASMSEYKHSI